MGNTQTGEKLCQGNVGTDQECDLWQLTQEFFKTKNRKPPDAQECKKLLKPLFKLLWPKYHPGKPFMSDPKMIAEILNNDLHFVNWGQNYSASPLILLNKEMQQSVNLGPTIKQLSCIAERHPPLCQMAFVILEQKNLNLESYFIPYVDGVHEEPTGKSVSFHTLMLMTLHTMYIFDVLVKYAVDHVQFQYDLINYYNAEKRKHYKSVRELVKKTNVFSLVKGESVNWEFPIWAKMRALKLQGVKDTDKRVKDLSDKSRFGLTLNVMEAVQTDKFHYKLPENADAGLVLVFNPVGAVSIESNPNKGMSDIVKIQMPGIWDALYFSWNLCFISKISHPHLTLAKLFHPFVSCAEPDDFIYRRAISLAITVQSFMLDQLQKKPYLSRFPGNSHKLFGYFTQALANINKECAQYIADKVNKGDINSMKYKARQYIKNSGSFTMQLFKMIAGNPLKQTLSRSDYVAPNPINLISDMNS